MDDKRRIPDRRHYPTKPLSRYSLKGLRSKSRRAGEDKDYYVDRYEPRYFVLITLILLLCILDAYYTLKILQAGGKELNPFMLHIMDKNPVLALVIKYLITAGGIGILIIFKNFVVFGRVRVSSLISVVFLLYLFLVIFEISFYYSRIHGHDFFP
jgi:Fe2+ transport system protein B